MQDYERTRASQWLREMRGDLSQDRLAADITATTGWTITRDRYSKYESGTLPFGKVVLGHFVDYWQSKGRPGPDLTPPAPEVSLELRAVLAAERQAAALEGILSLLLVRARPEDDRLEGLLDGLLDGVERAVAPTLLRRPTPDPHPTTA